MDFPDELLLKRIVQRNLYRDAKSLEQSTNTTKAKLKLASNPLLEQYFFHVLTSRRVSCKRDCTLFIPSDEWEEVAHPHHLSEPLSCCDISKFELLGKDELIEKMRDRKNGFPYVARMPVKRYRQLKKLMKTAVWMQYIATEDIPLLKEALAERVEEIAKELKL